MDGVAEAAAQPRVGCEDPVRDLAGVAASLGDDVAVPVENAGAVDAIRAGVVFEGAVDSVAQALGCVWPTAKRGVRQAFPGLETERYGTRIRVEFRGLLHRGRPTTVPVLGGRWCGNYRWWYE